MAAEISLKNECPQGECCTVISSLGNRSFEHLRISNPALISMIVEKDARIATLDIDEKKRNSSEIKWLPRGHGFSRPTYGLDPWSRKNDKKKFDIMRSGKLNIPESNLKWMLMHDYSDPNRPRPCLDARCLRRTRPDYILVTVEKDARSDIPDIEMKKYQVHGEMALDEFMYLVMVWIGVSRGKPVYAFFRKTQFPKGALMSAIYQENVGEDGYLHMTYTGEDDVPGSFGCALQ